MLRVLLCHKSIGFFSADCLSYISSGNQLLSLASSYSFSYTLSCGCIIPCYFRPFVFTSSLCPFVCLSTPYPSIITDASNTLSNFKYHSWDSISTQSLVSFSQSVNKSAIRKCKNLSGNCKIRCRK